MQLEKDDYVEQCDTEQDPTLMFTKKEYWIKYNADFLADECARLHRIIDESLEILKK